MFCVSHGMITRCARPVWVLMAAFVLTGARTAAGDAVDDEIVDDVPVFEPQLEFTDAAVYGRVFGDGADREAGGEQLDALLRQKIAIVDRVCGLTAAQKHKLQLAGRGDATRLFDRVDRIGARIQLVGDDREKIYELLDEAHSLQRDRVRPGFSTDGSLFFKSLEQLLTAEQAARYAPLRAIVGAGGLVRIRRDMSGELLEISLPGIAPVDDALAHLRDLPDVHVLVLARSQVTDAGLAQLAGLASLRTLVLNQTNVTDKGVAELKGLTELRELALDETPVTDAGLEHLQGLTGLQFVSLKGTAVTSAGLAHLKGLTRLESLVLDETKVTDAGLVHLQGLTSLQLLLVRSTAVTKSGIAQLKRPSPRLAIHK
jgi:hypothetical protein